MLAFAEDVNSAKYPPTEKNKDDSAAASEFVYHVP
jgi:hypothetical protein